MLFIVLRGRRAFQTRFHSARFTPAHRKLRSASRRGGRGAARGALIGHGIGEPSVATAAVPPSTGNYPGMAESIVLLSTWLVAALLYGGWRCLRSCIAPLAADHNRWLQPPSPPPPSHRRQSGARASAASTTATRDEHSFDEWWDAHRVTPSHERTPPALTNADPRGWRSEKLPWKGARSDWAWSPTVVAC